MKRSPRSQTELVRAIDQGTGRAEADLVVKDVRLLDVITGAITKTDIAICGDLIVGIDDSYRGKREIDAKGAFAAPGFIDTHMHVQVIIDDAARVRPLRSPARGDDGDLRSA